MAPHPWRPPNKRPRPSSSRNTQKESNEPEYPSSAYIQVYEAQLVYGQHGSSVRGHDHALDGQETRGGPGERLIRWAGAEEGEEVWADRYNVIHLLPSLPPLTTISQPRPPSPAVSSTSWDDRPSDQEELFDLSGDEAIEAYEREKKRKWLERLREERLREREEEDGAEEVRREGGMSNNEVDEELPESTRTLMHHTAKSIYSSPNPKTLEMRILANHAGDSRFAFLRGKWAREWEKAKRRVRVEMGLEKDNAGMGLLGGYESESDSGSEDIGNDEEAGPPVDEPPPPPPPPPDDGQATPPSPPDQSTARNDVIPDRNVFTESVGANIEVNDAVMDPVEMAVRQAEKDLQAEDKRRMRREKLEEWKRNKRKAAESTGS